MKQLNDLNIAIVHDDIVQWGGAEKVLVTISEMFPKAPIYTSVFDTKNKILSDKFSNKTVITSFMQKIPFWKSLYKILLPIYPFAFEQFDFSNYDLVISQSTRFAKSIITKPTTKHVCYCHTPPRFLWKFSTEKVFWLLNPYFTFLRLYDQMTAHRVDLFLAGSHNAKNRIKKIYNLDALVLQPFVDIKFFNTDNSFYGDYYLIIARLNSYKKVNLAIDAFNKSGKKLKVIGRGPEFSKLIKKSKSNIQFMSGLSDNLLLNIIQGCQALIITAEEDFGLTSLEAQACGKPVIAYNAGGSRETVIEGKTGIFFDDQDSESLINAVERFETMKFSSSICRQNSEKFSEDKFKDKLIEILKNTV